MVGVQQCHCRRCSQQDMNHSCLDHIVDCKFQDRIAMALLRLVNSKCLEDMLFRYQCCLDRLESSRELEQMNRMSRCNLRHIHLQFGQLVALQ